MLVWQFAIISALLGGLFVCAVVLANTLNSTNRRLRSMEEAVQLQTNLLRKLDARALLAQAAPGVQESDTRVNLLTLRDLRANGGRRAVDSVAVSGPVVADRREATERREVAERRGITERREVAERGEITERREMSERRGIAERREIADRREVAKRRVALDHRVPLDRRGGSDTLAVPDWLRLSDTGPEAARVSATAEAEFATSTHRELAPAMLAPAPVVMPNPATADELVPAPVTNSDEVIAAVTDQAAAVVPDPVPSAASDPVPSAASDPAPSAASDPVPSVASDPVPSAASDSAPAATLDPLPSVAAFDATPSSESATDLATISDAESPPRPLRPLKDASAERSKADEILLMNRQRRKRRARRGF